MMALPQFEIKRRQELQFNKDKAKLIAGMYGFRLVELKGGWIRICGLNVKLQGWHRVVNYLEKNL